MQAIFVGAMMERGNTPLSCMHYAKDSSGNADKIFNPSPHSSVSNLDTCILIQYTHCKEISAQYWLTDTNQIDNRTDRVGY